MQPDLTKPYRESTLLTIENLAQSIPERFEAQVDRTPGKLAVRCGGKSLSYDALNRAANRVAHALLDRSRVDKEPVALLFGHEVMAIVGILAVLKTGKIYVPLDPRFPPARTVAMLKHAAPRFLLTDSRYLTQARKWAFEGLEILNVEALGEEILDLNPDRTIAPSAPAYILYSSGSTGQPKGVLHSHRNVMHHVWDNANSYGLGSHDHHALVLSCCYAASTSEIFGALLNGASLSLFDVKAADLDQLVVWLQEEAVSVLKLPIALYRPLASSLRDTHQLPDLRLVVVGGDTLYPKDVKLFKQHFPSSCRMVNRLASTETNTMAHIVFDHKTRVDDRVATVGHAAVDKEILILDEGGKPLGAGQVGQIAVRSRYLALAYWRNDTLTRQAFRQVSENGKVRTYCTGDLGRLRPDGQLEHLGRIDSQIKIRGYRVELREVKSVLLKCNGVTEAEVIACEAETGSKVLTAYLVSAAGKSLSISAIRSAVAAVLPDYMVPSAFVVLDKLPLTPTGKVDHRLLPPPDQVRPARQEPVLEPRDDLERLLAGIWETVLGVQQVGIQDDFFELGGHSLAAIRLGTHIRNRLGRPFPVANLLQAPTVEQQAVLLRLKVTSETGTTVVALQESGCKPPFFCVPPAGNTVLIFSDLARHLEPDQPFYGLQHVGMDADREPHWWVENMAALYLRDIRRVQPEGPYTIGGMCFGGVVAYEMAQQLKEQGEAVALLAILDTLNPPALLSVWRRPAYVRHWLEMRCGEKWHRWPPGRWLMQRQAAGSRAEAPANLDRDEPASERNAMTLQIEKVWQAHSHAHHSYVARVYPGRITLFWSKDIKEKKDRRADWAKLSTEPLKICEIPGNHDRTDSPFIHEPHVGELARILTACLARSEYEAAGRRHTGVAARSKRAPW